MSLHALAGHMASKGRGSDSMLVHMTPEEVQSLQVLALKGGGTLTINPDTGLPEANFLKKMLPMIAGFALGPAGFGLMSAGMAGAAVGGITALSTGSLSRGLMAGLGAYGGASLGGSLAGAGAGTSAANAAALGVEGAATGIGSQAAMLAEQTAGFGAEGLSSLADSARVAVGAAPSKAGMLSAGFDAVTKSPEALGKFAKSNYGALAAAVSPMMAADSVQTTTKRPDTGTIRNYTFDPYGQTYTSAGNYPASEYKGMAQGGIVALAAGGVSDKDIQNWMAANQGADDKTIAAAMQQYGVAPSQLSSAMGYNPQDVEQRYAAATSPAPSAAPAYTPFTNEQIGSYLAANPNIDIAAETAKLNADPRAVNQYISSLGAGFLDPTETTRGSGSGQYYDAFTRAGIDANELFAANQALNPNDNTGLTSLTRAFDTAAGFKGFDPQGTDQLAKDIQWVKKMDADGRNATDIAQLTGLSINEVAAREAAARAAMKPKTVAAPALPSGDTGLGGVSGGSGGGNTVLNPDGTITSAPNIPGRPAGGFTGMGQLKDVYTQGGGSLGYVNPAPKTMEEFDQRFNKQTGDSLAAYNYLMGKGANPIKSGVGEIMRPYSEAVRGIPVAEGRPTQKYIFQNGKYVENPNYRPLSYNSKGERMVGMTSSEVIKGIQGLKDPKDDGALFDFVTENRISEAQLAAALGIPIAEARARIAAGKKIKGITTTGNAASDANMGGGDGAPGGDGAGAGSGTGDSGPGGAADGGSGPGDGPGTGAGWAYGGEIRRMALGGLGALAGGGSTSQYNLGGYSDGGRLLRGPGDGVSDSIPATIGNRQPARLADGEFVVPARIVSELGNGSTEAGARKLYAMMDRVQKARGKTTGKNRVAANTRSDKYLPA